MRMLTTAVNTLLKRENSLLQRHGFAHVVAQRTNSVHQTETKVPKIPPFSYSPPPYDGPSTGEIIAKRREFLSPALFHFYNTPVQNKGPFSFPLKRRRLFICLYIHTVSKTKMFSKKISFIKFLLVYSRKKYFRRK